MTVLTLIAELKKQSLDIKSIDGNLHIRPRDRITESIRQAIRFQKLALVDFIEAYEERAAIMEYDAGLLRQEAEASAFHELTKGQTP